MQHSVVDDAGVRPFLQFVIPLNILGNTDRIRIRGSELTDERGPGWIIMEVKIQIGIFPDVPDMGNRQTPRCEITDIIDAGVRMNQVRVKFSCDVYQLFGCFAVQIDSSYESRHKLQDILYLFRRGIDTHPIVKNAIRYSALLKRLGNTRGIRHDKEGTDPVLQTLHQIHDRLGSSTKRIRRVEYVDDAQSIHLLSVPVEDSNK